MVAKNSLSSVHDSDVLYHEIGHHIHAEHKPVHEEKENVADDWSHKLWGILFGNTIGMRFLRFMRSQTLHPPS
jgi:hypothetical protein